MLVKINVFKPDLCILREHTDFYLLPKMTEMKKRFEKATCSLKILRYHMAKFHSIFEQNSSERTGFDKIRDLETLDSF